MSYFKFNTKANSYIFDNVSVYVISASEHKCSLIDNIDDDAYIESMKFVNDEVKHSVIEEVKFLTKCCENGMFKQTPNDDELISTEESREIGYETNFSNLILVVTEDCNLRCKYCCYSDRYKKNMGFSNEKMNIDTAIKAVDMFYEVYKSEN